MLPTNLPFEERKEKFIKSEAWNCWVNQHNIHLNPEEITEIILMRRLRMSVGDGAWI